MSEAENPLKQGLERTPVPPTALTIFGATGDLSKRKLLPAIYNLAHEGALPERFTLIGISRSPKSDDEFRGEARAAIVEHSRREPDPDVLDGLLALLRYVGFSFDDDAGYVELRKLLEQADADSGEDLARCYYLSTAPEYFSVIPEKLHAQGLHKLPDAPVRLIVEKPFGSNLASARELQATISRYFREHQIFRIDHYLGKETVQNMMAFRFANTMFEPVWNRNYIEDIQITAAEDIGIGTRAGYYDSSGAMRDLVQNHMLQLLCMTCMEPPVSFEAEKVRDEKVKVLEAIAPYDAAAAAANTVRAQYGPGAVSGEDVPGYRQEQGVPEDSRTETYAALRLHVENWRWAGVPIFLRTGKRLARKVTEIAIQLKPVPHMAFAAGADGSVGPRPNQLVITLQPDEGVTLQLGAKIPGAATRIRPVTMEFRYGTSFLSQSPEAYERLIIDAMRGEATLFTRNDEVDAQWSIIDPILKAWSAEDFPLYTYEAGSQGPDAAAELMGVDRSWRRL